MKLRKKIAFLVVLAMLALNTLTVQARDNKSDDRNNNNNNGNSNSSTLQFSDVPTTHWAYSDIMLMANYKIITGYSNSIFKPDAPVSRAEFAKMMVLTMQMDLTNPAKATFDDVHVGGWEYKYIETAKTYMTAYKTANGLIFKPSEGAQREDMAVSIIKGLGLSPSTDLNVLNTLTDSSSISPNVTGYVAKAMSEGIMIGDSNKKFNPKATITRAETATLLARLIHEEKVVFDEEKVVFDTPTGTANKTPFLAASVINKKVILDWTNVASEGFSYYKVVLSKTDSTPSYPENGYATAISNVSASGFEFEAGAGYNSGLDGEIKPGTYYVAITAVYGDKKLTSNVVTITVPEKAVVSNVGKTPVLSSLGIVDGGIKLSWTKTDNVDGFQFYKVVLSKSVSSPSYPGNGYATYISDNSVTTYVIKDGQSYNSGDIGGNLEDDVPYHVAITDVYSDGNFTSLPITVTLP
ncbi:MAG: S-layer homology domain-containing protein [Vallitaleaceae bacterium]|nr:S-layer homology domain-containing protein [Vallitaleaceae bacterium]